MDTKQHFHWPIHCPLVMRILHFFHNRNALFVLAFCTGLLIGDAASPLEPLIVPALILALTFSITIVPNHAFRFRRKLFASTLAGVFLNYILLTGFLLGCSIFFSSAPSVQAGLVILAAAPPAVAVIPFTEFLKGDLTYSLLATIGTYLAALLLLPFVTLTFTGVETLDLGRLLRVTAQLILLPILASRLLVFVRLDSILRPVRGKLVNWCFFLVIMTLVGINRPYMESNLPLLMPLIVVCLGATFGLGILISTVCDRFEVNPRRRVSMMLLGTLKNAGFAGGMALTLVDARAALPAVVFTACMIPFIIAQGYSKKSIAAAR
ncbi:MAG: hypothetical protein ACLFQR_00275 [Desulfovibrionales bacterium]